MSKWVTEAPDYFDIECPTRVRLTKETLADPVLRQQAFDSELYGLLRDVRRAYARSLGDLGYPVDATAAANRERETLRAFGKWAEEDA